MGSKDDQTKFRLCAHKCPSLSHINPDGKPHPDSNSYCELPLFHKPYADPNISKKKKTITEDGHLFPCYHVPPQDFNIVLVLDRSGSMSGRKWTTLCEAFQEFINKRNQLGTLDRITVVLFHSEAEFLFQHESTRVDFMTTLRKIQPSGETNFARPLKLALQHLSRNNADFTTPALVFLSDGECNNGIEEVTQLKTQVPCLQVFVVGFDVGRAGMAQLQKLADAGKGKLVPATSLSLVNTFEEIHNALDPVIISAVKRPDQ